MSAAAPAISVVVRTLGSSRVAEALASLARQTRRDFEVVLVDMSGGRIDAALEPFAPELPSCRRLAPGRRLSRPAALNAGVAAARAPRIGVLDDDNLYDPDQLARLADFLDSTGADYVYAGVRHATYTAQGVPLACREVSVPFRLDLLLLGNYIYATGSLYRKAAWERVGGYDERFTVFEDWDFILRVAQAGSVAHLPGIAGESSKFTGRDDLANFDLELAAVRRCLAGVYWKHRRFYRGALRHELKIAAAEHCRRRVPARRGLLARTVAGWRLELARDLAAWWWGNLTAAARRSAG